METIDLIINELDPYPYDLEPPTKKIKTENTFEELKFAIGLWSGPKGKKRVRSRKRKKINSSPCNDTNKSIHTKVLEKIALSEPQLTRLFILVNPFEVKARVFTKVRELADPIYDFANKKFSLIKLIIPILKPQYLTYKFAYWNLQYTQGDFFDWQIKLRQTTQQKLKPDLQVCERQSIKPNKYYISATRDIYEINQWARWQLKRIVRIWLINKSLKRVIGDDVDLVTLEKIPPQEQIKVLSLTSRCMYIFSGASLKKSFLSNLGSQVASISSMTSPKNPFTNVAFTYGELLHLCNEIGGWCFRHNKPYPAIISMFREQLFKINVVITLHSNYVQYSSTKTYIMDDDVTGEFFFENLEVMLDSYTLYLVPYHTFLDPEPFRAWQQDEPTHYLLKNWKQLVCDYWHYKQSDHLIRENWRNEMSILYDIELLAKASESILRYYAD